MADASSGDYLFPILEPPLSLTSTVWSEKSPARFCEGSSVMAVVLRMRIGCPKLVVRRKTGNSNMQEFFCTTLYVLVWKGCIDNRYDKAQDHKTFPHHN